MISWAALSSRACDVCGCYMPQLGAASPGQETSLALTWLRGTYGAVAEQFTHFGTVQMDGDEVSNPTGQYLDSFITQLEIGRAHV